MEPHSVSFEVTEEDIVAFSRYYYRHTKEGRSGMWRMYAIGVGMFLLLAASEYHDENYGVQNNPAGYALYLLMAALVLGLGYGSYLTVVRPFIISKLFKGEEFKKMLGRTTLTLHRHEVSVLNDHGRGRIAWPAIAGVAESRHHIYLLLGPMKAFIVPKAAFASDAAAKDFFAAASDLKLAHG